MSFFSHENPTQTRGGFYKAIYALRLKFALCANLFSQILYHVFAPYAQLIAFSPRIGCALHFTLYTVRPTFMKSIPGSVRIIFFVIHLEDMFRFLHGQL
jgi:hypothetical protein